MSAMINIDEELQLAISSSDITVLDKLKRSVNTVVRRALTTNIHTPKEILNILAYDPVLNVSYMATQNPNCSIKRDFNNISHPCIKCSEHIGSNSCNNCSALLEFNALHGY
jgi:hypothetical protein